ncbi:hypothetical protein GmHk_18G051489 [Glycine max]|nr:hypothetical protein GmHk_18G051489 [Glycine max]
MDQPYNEVSRSFAIRWKDELEHTWNLLDTNDNMHSITYSQDMANPILLARWTELKHFYGLIRNHQMIMTHFGQSVLFLTIFKSSSKPRAYLKWHYLYHQVSNSDTFEVLLSEYKVTCNSLDVPSIMYSFMKAARFTHLNLEEITK